MKTMVESVKDRWPLFDSSGGSLDWIFSFCFWSHYAAYWFAFWKKYRLHCWKTCMYHVLFRSIFFYFFGVIFSFVLYKVWYVQYHFKCVNFLPLFCVFCSIIFIFYLYSPWNVLLSNLNGERTVSALWTVSVNGAKRRAQVNALWTDCERMKKWESRTFQWLYLIFLYLHCVHIICIFRCSHMKHKNKPSTHFKCRKYTCIWNV